MITPPGSKAVSRPPRPLRTVRTTFTVHGSSMTNAQRTRRFSFTIGSDVPLSVAVRVVVVQIGDPVILPVAVPMMESEVLSVLEHLPAPRTGSILHAMYLSHDGGSQGEDQLFIAALEVRRPLSIEWVGFRSDFDVATLFYRLGDTDQAFACAGVGEAPAVWLSLDEIPIGDPAPRLVRVTILAPSKEPFPYVAVERPEGLGTDVVPVIVCPTAQHGVQFLDESFWCCAFLAFGEGFDLVLDGLETGLARRDLQLAEASIGQSVFPDVLS